MLGTDQELKAHEKKKKEYTRRMRRVDAYKGKEMKKIREMTQWGPPYSY